MHLKRLTQCLTLGLLMAAALGMAAAEKRQFQGHFSGSAAPVTLDLNGDGFSAGQATVGGESNFGRSSSQRRGASLDTRRACTRQHPCRKR